MKGRVLRVLITLLERGTPIAPLSLLVARKPIVFRLTLRVNRRPRSIPHVLVASRVSCPRFRNPDGPGSRAVHFHYERYVHRPLVAGPGHRQAERRNSHAGDAFRRLIGTPHNGEQFSPYSLFPFTL